jgi:transposase
VLLSEATRPQSTGPQLLHSASDTPYRDRHTTSRAKSDKGDAKLLADLVRTDRHNHRPVAVDSELLEAIKVLARSHQNLIWTRQRQTNQLRSTLREFYPGALAAFDDLAHPDAIGVLAKAPTPELGRRLSTAQIHSALARGGRQRNLDRRAAQIRDALRAPQLGAGPLVEDAYGTVVAALVPLIAGLNEQIAALEQRLTERLTPVRIPERPPAASSRTSSSASSTAPSPQGLPTTNTSASEHGCPTKPNSPLDKTQPWGV